MSRRAGHILAFALALLLIAPASLAAGQDRERPGDPLIVFAAASLSDALQTIGDAYTKSSGVPVTLSFAASSALARQIEAGARADIFLSANREWMDYLQRKQLIDSASRVDLLGNRLALIAPRDSTVAIELAPGAPLLAALGSRGRLATGDPDAVPVGKYAKSALGALDLWDAIAPRLVRAENVRAALMYVARGEAPLGIVYATDVRVEPRVRIVELFPESSHAPITYPAARTIHARPPAASFMAYLRGPAARAVFIEAGFTVLPAATQRAGDARGH